MAEQKSFIIEGEAFYANLDVKGQLSGKFEISVGRLTKESVALLEGAGITVHKEDKLNKKTGAVAVAGPHVAARTTFEVSLVDSKKQAIDIGTKIGNGSKVRVAVNIYLPKGGPKMGQPCLGLQAVQIIELVEFESNSTVASFDEVDGFDIATAAVPEAKASGGYGDDDAELFS